MVSNALTATLFPLRLQVFRILDQGAAHEEGERSDRNIQIKDPAPAVIVGDVAAERRPDHRREQRGKAKDGHRRALLLLRERIEEHRLTRRLQSAAGQALQRARRDDEPEAARHPAHRRREGEHRDRGEEIIAPPQPRREPSGHRQDDRVGGEVAGDDPFAVGRRRRQSARDVAQRDIGDGGVEHLHEGRDHHRRPRSAMG